MMKQMCDTMVVKYKKWTPTFMPLLPCSRNSLSRDWFIKCWDWWPFCTELIYIVQCAPTIYPTLLCYHAYELYWKYVLANLVHYLVKSAIFQDWKIDNLFGPTVASRGNKGSQNSLICVHMEILYTTSHTKNPRKKCPLYGFRVTGRQIPIKIHWDPLTSIQ